MPHIPTSPYLGSGLLLAAQKPPHLMPVGEYLQSILTRERVHLGLLAPIERAYSGLMPAINSWANGNAVAISPSGSFAKGTANSSGTDLDLFLSIPAHVKNTVAEAYGLLAAQLRKHGFAPKLQNVSIGVTIGGLSSTSCRAACRIHFARTILCFIVERARGAKRISLSMLSS